tara:strand:+ start:157 stop:1182 length:1026 start_codon:yes stop_codon:yes gene_type:complete
MIQARRSDEHLHSDIVLSRVSEYEIFRYFCRNFKEIDRKFCSDLREDKTPTVSITFYKQRLWYYDFGYPEHKFTCFDYVAFKYGTDFYGALIHIDECFGLGLRTGVRVKRPVLKVGQPVLREKKKSEIQVRVRPWDSRDAVYWKQFGISKKILLIFDVQPISHYWINEQRFSCDSISYRYRFDCGYKIYRPLERDFKWSSNVGMECLQGYPQLPPRGDTVVLTSSLKDVMCMAVLGYPSFALQSEMFMPREETISKVKTRFKEIVVLYDNDFDNPRNPGQTMAVKICEKYGLDNIVIPSYYRSKDISDLIKDHGLQEAKHVIERQENRHTYVKKESTERQE